MIERCLNCDTPLDGDYCSTCGQSVGTLDVPITTFASALVSETLSLDGRVRTTLGPLFFRPGRVAREYVAGRRARFVPPIRLYVFASFFMFLVLGISQRTETAALDAEEAGAASRDSIVSVAPSPADSTGLPDISYLEELGFEVDFGGSEFEREILSRLNEGARQALVNREGFYQDISSGVAAAMFILLPFFALLLKSVYWKRLYVHHAVFTIYLHCVGFLVLGLLTLPGVFLADRTQWWELLFPILIPIYTVLAVRDFYGSSWLGTLFRLAFIGFVYLFVTTLTWLGIVLGSLLLA